MKRILSASLIAGVCIATVWGQSANVRNNVIPFPANVFRAAFAFQRSLETAGLTQEQIRLVGLQGVAIFVDDLDLDVESHGLRREQIETDLKQMLQAAEIDILTEKQLLLTMGRPFLCIHIQTIGNTQDGYIYSLEVALREKVYLERNRLIRTDARTWSESHLGTVGASDVGRIRDVAKDCVDEFINDYRVANAKKSPTP